MCVSAARTQWQLLGHRREGTGCQLLGSDQGCGHPCPVVSTTGASGVFNLQPLGQEWCVSRKPATRETGVSEANEALSASSWSGTTGHSLCAGCWLLGASGCTFPKPGGHGVCAWICWQTPSWTSWQVGGPGSGQGYQAGRGSVLVFGGTHKCGVPVGRVCECCMLTASTQLDQPVSGIHAQLRCLLNLQTGK